MATPNQAQQALLGDLNAASSAVASALATVKTVQASAVAKGAPEAAGILASAAAAIQVQADALATLAASDAEIANLG